MQKPLPKMPDVPTKYKSLDYRDFGGGYNSRDAAWGIKDNQLAYGSQNVVVSPANSAAKRLGHTLYGNYMGATTGVLGLIAHEPQGGTAEFLSVYDTAVMRYVSGTWTALTGVTMTTNKPADSAYFPLTSKTYIVNQTDAVVKYASGSSGDQSDASFKKGKYILHFKNRLLVANVTGQEDYIWYTDLGVDTFSANNYLRALGEITGMEVLYDKWLTFTKRKVFVTPNFTFTGVAAGPESFNPLPTDFGAVYDRTIAKVKNLVYFLGQDSEGVAAVYVTDGINVGIISDEIATDINGLSPTQLASACASAYGRFFRLSVAPSGASANTREYLYDTVMRHWLPPFTNSAIGGFSCYASVATSGQLDLYAGSQSDGRVYKLSQANYDEGIDKSYVSGQDSDGAVDANPALRAAQSFQVSAAAPRTLTVTGAAVYLKKNAGTTTDLSLRIETNSAGVPSGTLANANLTGTITAFSGTSYAWYTVKFATPASLSAATSYWLVLKHATEGSGTSQYYWGYDGSSPTFAGGNGATYASGSWTAQSGRDYLFVLFAEEAIYGKVVTKAFYLSPQGQLARLPDLFVTAKASGNWNLQVGVNTGEYAAFSYQDMNLSSNGPLFGSTLVIGTSVLGSQQQIETRLRFPGNRGHTFQFAFQNMYDNEPFTVYGFRTRHEVINRIK